VGYLNTVRKIKEELRGRTELESDFRTSTDFTEGPIIAVLIDSPIVGPVWFSEADAFQSGDNIPVFFMRELPYLQKMKPTELRKRYEEKRIFGGTRIVGRRGTKH